MVQVMEQQKFHEHNHTFKMLSMHGKILLTAEPGRFLPLRNEISSSISLWRYQSQYLFLYKTLCSPRGRQFLKPQRFLINIQITISLLNSFYNLINLWPSFHFSLENGWVYHHAALLKYYYHVCLISWCE